MQYFAVTEVIYGGGYSTPAAAYFHLGANVWDGASAFRTGGNDKVIRFAYRRMLARLHPRRLFGEEHSLHLPRDEPEFLVADL